jgi:hypothetical protein
VTLDRCYHRTLVRTYAMPQKINQNKIELSTVKLTKQNKTKQNKAMKIK